MQLAGLNPAGVLCEVTNPDGTMARAEEIVAFGKLHNMPVLTIDDIVQYRESLMKNKRRLFVEVSYKTIAIKSASI